MHFVWWTALLLRLRRMLSRNELAVRLLGLPRETAHAQACGLVLIQIDGLSRRQLETAIAKRRMPFLHKLLHREHYRLTSLYSGIPSSTPSVQGELFYGVRCATPAFSFFSESLGRQVSMSEPEAAIEVESRIAVDRPGLLEGGSAYCDVYTGGAREAHFCAQNLGLGGFLASVRLSRLLVVATWYVWSLIRAAGLTLLEIALAIGGFVSGALRRGEFFAELGFIPARVAIVVLMRELVTIGATLDVARGVPIVHLNLLGYDEQAHRRGPESDFAHWTLKGIDHAVKTIWQAAHRSQLRHYDVWVYSDHGQETTTPYAQRHGQTIQQTVAKLLGEETIPSEPPAARSALTERAQWLGGGRIAQWLLGAKPFAADKSPTNPVKVVATGPGGVVFSRALGVEQRLRLALRLVSVRYCPLVLVR
ncbi:MAG: alkaline phosphatase family protein, partial [Planctomycetota bacterium]